VLCHAYGFDNRVELVSAICRRMEHLLAVGQERLAAGDEWALRTADARLFWEHVDAFVRRHAEALG